MGRYDAADLISGYNGLTAAEQLNLYRNKYYSDGNATEKGIIANAIDDVLPKWCEQKAEIERLKLENKTLSEVNQIIAHQRNQRDEEIEELQTQIDGLHVYVNKIKSEAYKEFAKRLKDAFPDGNRDCKCPAIYFDDYCYIVDECCEEMVGEENEKEKPPQIDEEQFVEKYCGMCGNQRCMGVGSEMFDGCLYKEELKHE